MDAAAEQELRAARHEAAEREAFAEAKQLRAEVRRLAHQLNSIKRGLRWGRITCPALAALLLLTLVACRDEADVSPSPEASQPFAKQVSVAAKIFLRCCCCC